MTWEEQTLTFVTHKFKCGGCACSLALYKLQRGGKPAHLGLKYCNIPIINCSADNSALWQANCGDDVIWSRSHCVKLKKTPKVRQVRRYCGRTYAGSTQPSACRPFSSTRHMHAQVVTCIAGSHTVAQAPVLSKHGKRHALWLFSSLSSSSLRRS